MQSLRDRRREIRILHKASVKGFASRRNSDKNTTDGYYQDLGLTSIVNLSSDFYCIVLYTTFGTNSQLLQPPPTKAISIQQRCRNTQHTKHTQSHLLLFLHGVFIEEQDLEKKRARGQKSGLEREETHRGENDTHTHAHIHHDVFDLRISQPDSFNFRMTRFTMIYTLPLTSSKRIRYFFLTDVRPDSLVKTGELGREKNGVHLESLA